MNASGSPPRRQSTGRFMALDPGQRPSPQLQSNGCMRTPNVFLAYAPRGPGLRSALAYLASECDVYGWFTGPRHDATVASAFFLIEDFYTNRPTRYEAVHHADLHSAWSLDEARRHEL